VRQVGLYGVRGSSHVNSFVRCVPEVTPTHWLPLRFDTAFHAGGLALGRLPNRRAVTVLSAVAKEWVEGILAAKEIKETNR
jgi:hypothetical protein